MKYNRSQVEAIGDELRSRFINNQAEGIEIVVALVSMYQAGRIDLDHFKDILRKVYTGDVEGMIRALHQATALIDKELIDEILLELPR